MKKGRFTARPKEQYKIYGETYASADTIGNWFNFEGNKENYQNVANRLNPTSRPAIKAPLNSGPIIEEVNSDDEVDVVGQLSSTMHDTTLEDRYSGSLREETYDVSDFDMGPLTSTVQRGKSSRNFGNDFFNGDPDISMIFENGSVGSQQSTGPNKGVIHFDDVPSSRGNRGSKRSSQPQKLVSIIAPDKASKRRCTPPLDFATPRLSRINRSSSTGDISNRKNYQKIVGNFSLSKSSESEDLDYSSEEEDNFSEAEDVEVVYSEGDLSEIDEDELESVRVNVRKHQKDVIAKNIKFIDKLNYQRNLQFTNKLSSKLPFNIPRAPFSRLVREICQDFTKTDCRLGKDVVEILQTVSEQYIIDCFKMANVVTGAREKATLYPRDMRAARKIMSISGS
uniref:Histone domain-containing protein n=1 Tax=Strongyloides stercoralis TaxID=6248 RepID=A0A0K0E8W7_STRER